MRFALFILLIPFFADCQTVHIEKGRIAYKENVKVNGIAKAELYERARQSLLKNVKHAKEIVSEKDSKDEMIMSGEMRLSSTHGIIKTLEYVIKISVKDEGYKYEIDSVYIKSAEKGGKTIIMPSEELVKGMDMTGNPAIDAEKQLNEIDMRIQQLLDFIYRDVKRR
jgi:hypothetical protein